MSNLTEFKKELSHLTLLIVDDEEIIRDVFGTFFSKIFNKVVLAENANDALEKYSNDKFDCVITDYYMPGMNGVELARKIKEKNSNTFIAIATGSPDELTLEKESFDYLLGKPPSMDAMGDIMAEIVNYQSKSV